MTERLNTWIKKEIRKSLKYFKQKTQSSYDPATPAQGTHLDKTLKAYMYPYVQSTSAHNGQDVEAT